MRVNAL
jgi:hypothetical protein